MATQQPLILTRNQLASFLKDNEQIRQFEKLLSIANSVNPTNTTAELALQKAKYNEVLVWLTTP